MRRLIAELRIQRGTASQWAARNPILDDGEPGFERNTGRLKVGDGVTPWNLLPYTAEDGPPGEPGPPGDPGEPGPPGDSGLIGSGFPEGVVSAPPGTLYTDDEATAGAQVWIKKTGTGNTGWSLVFGDTGWRNLQSLLESSSLDAANAGFVHVRRVGELVHYRFSNLLLAPGVGTLMLWTSVPVGFQSVDLQVGRITSGNNMNEEQRLAFLSNQMGWLSTELFASGDLISSPTRPSVGIAGTTNFLTNDPWPNSLPGTPA